MVHTHLSLFFSKILFIYSWETQREAETQAEGEAGSTQGAWYGTRSGVSRIIPQAEGGDNLMGHQGRPCPWEVSSQILYFCSSVNLVILSIPFIHLLLFCYIWNIAFFRLLIFILWFLWNHILVLQLCCGDGRFTTYEIMSYGKKKFSSSMLN